MQGRKKWLAGCMAACVLAAGHFSPLYAAEGKTAGKARSRTGVLVKAEEGRLTLETGRKGGMLVLQLSPQTRLLAEKPAAPGQLQAGRLVRIAGQGKGNEVRARRIVLLEPAEELTQAKKSKTGPAYPAAGKNTEITVKISGLDPLQVVNRQQQILQVSLHPEAVLLAQVPLAASELAAGMKLRVEYRETETGNEAREIVVIADAGSKAAKK